MYQLIIGDKAYSSWSLRPWLLMRQAGVPFTEVPIRLRKNETKAEILKLSPSGYVPALRWGRELITDSLAICETIAELFPEKLLWPTDPLARAYARSAVAEMHAGFQDLRRDMPMDFLTLHPGDGHSEGALGNARRIVSLWMHLRRRFGAPSARDQGFLFGHFTVADAMYAPVVSRFTTYAVDLAALGDDGSAKAYTETIWALPAMADWREGAKMEMEARKAG